MYKPTCTDASESMSARKMHISQSCACLQTLGAGTFDEVFGPGKTPMWALPTDVVKYQKDQLIANETGFNLGSTVSLD